MDEKKVCFVIMPISDVMGYEEGHFRRVYEYIIKPACLQAGFTPIRADDVKKTNVIVIDILQKLLRSEMAICDLSSQNPNVLYELGIRQAFDLPVTFIKDDITSRIFDIQGYRDVEYSSNLRIDEVKLAVELLTNSIEETYESKPEDSHSIVSLLGIKKARQPSEVEISYDTDIILKSIQDLASRMNSFESTLAHKEDTPLFNYPSVKAESFIQGGEVYLLGETIVHDRFGKGKITDIQRLSNGEVKATFQFDQDGQKYLLMKFAKIKKL